MPIWYYEKSELHKTPTIQDGLDFSVEARYRKEGARFIIDAGTSLGLRYDTLATGVVYFHRFYMFHSFKTFPRYVTGAACLFLAGKVEETPKKCKDIVRAAKTLLPEHYFTTFGDDPKEEIMTFERILLQTIKFDLQVDHPYTYLLKYARVIKGDKAKIQQLVQMGWTFINDSLCTTLCLQWEPQVLAVAVMYLAGRLSKSDVLDWQCKGSRTKWWDPFIEDVTLEMLEDICHQVLDLYTGQDPTKSEGISMSAKHKMGRPKTPPEPAPPTPPPDEPSMKIAKTEHIAVTEQPTRQLPLPINPSQPPPVANFQQQVTSAYASLPPSLPPVPQATLPVAGTTAHDGPPPPTAQPTAAYPSGSYQQAPGSTAYSATQSYQPQQQPPPQTTGFSFPNAQASQPTASTSYSQKPGYDYTQTQAYGTQDSYPPSYNAPPTQASFGSYSQENTNTNQGSYNTPTRQYPTQYQQSGQYPANQNTVPPPNYPAQPPTPQPQHTLPPSQAAPTTAPPSLLAQQPYSMAGRGGGSTYPTTPPKNYPPPQTYNTPTRYDTPPPSLPQQQRGGPPTPGGMVPVSGALPPTPVTPGQVPPGSYPPQVWAPRGPPPRGPPPPNTAGSLSSLATVRITGRTDQRRSSTGKTQPPFFR